MADILKTTIDGYDVWECPTGDASTTLYLSKGRFNGSLEKVLAVGRLEGNSESDGLDIAPATVERLEKWAEDNGYLA